MTEFDPAALLKQIRSKTPSKVPELPPRPATEEPPLSKLNLLEDRIVALENQLKVALGNEQKAHRERDLALQQLKEAQTRIVENEEKFNEKIEFLQEMLDREKGRGIEKCAKIEKNEKNEERVKTPNSFEKKPPFSSAVSSNSLRFSGNKLKGILDLAPLVELYKIMPEFPRPVIKINFTGVLNT
jgi:hypothetical protein